MGRTHHEPTVTRRLDSAGLLDASVAPPTTIKAFSIGRSVQGRLIEAYACDRDACATIVLGGVHGDEPKSVRVAKRLVESLALLAEPLPACGWVIVPAVNPDGYARRRRRNANNVDLNRNLPTKNWESGSKRSRMFGGETPASEPEVRAIMGLIGSRRPKRIITIHSIDRGRFCNNYDGPGKEIARQLARSNGYPVVGSIGYPTPGSLGNWAGVERQIPTVTLELPSHHSSKRCWEANEKGLVNLLAH